MKLKVRTLFNELNYLIKETARRLYGFRVVLYATQKRHSISNAMALIFITSQKTALFVVVVPVADSPYDFEIIIGLSNRISQMTFAPECFKVCRGVSIYQMSEA